MLTIEEFDKEFVPDRNEAGYPIEFMTHEFSSARTLIRLGQYQNRRVAIKSSGYLTHEIKLHARIGFHPNIVQFICEIDYFESASDYYGFLMEGVKNGRKLDKYLYYIRRGSFSIPECIRLMEQLALALEYLHLKGIIHHDLKLENILIDETTMTLKLCDFGISELVDEHGHGKPENRESGTVAWLAPEQSPESTLPITVKIDVYNFGHICNAIIFKDRTSKQGIFDLPDKLWNLISSCSNRDPDERPTMTEFLTKLRAVDVNKNWRRDLKFVYEEAIKAKIPVPDEIAKAYHELHEMLASPLFVNN